MGNYCFRSDDVDTLFVDESLEEKERSVGFDKLLFQNPTEWRTMKKFCNKLDVRQYDLNLLYKTYCMDNSFYVRNYRIALIDCKINYLNWNPIYQEIADIYMPHIFLKEFSGLDDPYNDEEVSFARFVITGYMFCAQPLCDLVYDLIASVRDRHDLKVSSTMFAFNLNEMFALMSEGHQSTYLLKFLILLFKFVDIEKEITIKQIMILSMKYPIMFYSLERFRKDVRRRVFGDRFWLGSKMLSIDPKNPKGPRLENGLRLKPSPAAPLVREKKFAKKLLPNGQEVDVEVVDDEEVPLGPALKPRKTLKTGTKIPVTDFMYLESMQAFTDTAMATEVDANMYSSRSILSDMEFLLKNTVAKTDFSQTFATSTFKPKERNTKNKTDEDVHLFMDSKKNKSLEKSDFYEKKASELLGMVKNDVHRYECTSAKLARFFFLDELWIDSGMSSGSVSNPLQKGVRNEEIKLEKRLHIKHVSLDLYIYTKQFFGYKAASDILLSSKLPFSDDINPILFSNRAELEDPLYIFPEDRFYNASVQKEFVYNVRTNRRSWLFRIWDTWDDSRVQREYDHVISENSIRIMPKNENRASTPETPAPTANNNKRRGGK